MKIPNPRKLSNGTWFIYLRFNGDYISISAPTEKECIRLAQLRKAEHIAGVKERKQAPKKTTLYEGINMYIEDRKNVLSPCTIRGYRTIQRSRFQKSMSMPLEEMDRSYFQKMVNDEAKIVSAKTVQNAWGLVTATYAYVTGNAAPTVSLPMVRTRNMPYLEPEHIRPFINAVHGTKGEIGALLALSGLRRSEIMGLDWKDIDLKRRTINIHASVVPDENNNLVYKDINKNLSSSREIPILIDELYEALKKEKKPSGPVMTCHPNTISKWVASACKSIGCQTISVHGLRHSFASLAYHLGIPVKVLQEIGGWSDDRTLMKIYVRVAKSKLQESTKSLSKFFNTEQDTKD